MACPPTCPGQPETAGGQPGEPNLLEIQSVGATRPRGRGAPARALADAIILSSGWRRRLIAILSGGFGALALAPIGFAPALVVTMVVAVWLLDGTSAATLDETRLRRWPSVRSLGRAFGDGWWVGFGYFVAGFWWLSAAFLIDPDFTWALPFGVLGLPAILALFFGVGFALARLMWAPGSARVLALALGLSAAEWARGHLFTGFPWNPLGMGLGGTLLTAQLAAVVGLDGLTLVTIALFAAPATLFDSSRRLHWRPTILAASALALICAYGGLRLARSAPGDVPNVVVRIMQPGLRPDSEFSPENRDKIVDRYIALSERDDAAKTIKLADVTMLVWPESAFPFILTRDPYEVAKIGGMLPPHTSLVTGAAREVDVPAGDGHSAYSDYYNSIEVIARGGTILDTYDKVHLVPFGEYLPFDHILRALGLRNFVAVPGGFEFGGARHALAVPGMPSAAPLICYEAIFPGEVRTASDRPPRFLLNITNDGWFGLTSGPYQHFAQARLRTIEEGLPMIRGAATGISAIVDPYGRVLESLPLGPDGIIDGPLPEPVQPTVYARFGQGPFLVVWFSTLLIYLRFRSSMRRREKLPAA